MAEVISGMGAEPPSFPESGIQRLAIRILGLALFFYMAYATIYGPYKTTVVHLAIFAAAMLCIAFLGRSRSTDPLRRYIQLGWDMVAAAAAAAVLLVFGRASSAAVRPVRR